MRYEQIKEATLDKTTAVWPLIAHLINHPCKKNKRCWRSREELISDVVLGTPTDGHTSSFETLDVI